MCSDGTSSATATTTANHKATTLLLDKKRAPVVVAEDAPLIQHDPDSSSNCNHFLYPAEYEGHLEGVMIRGDHILERTDELAELIAADYKGKRPMMICTLKGASPVSIYIVT
jgi:hypothetical protein